MEKNAIKKYAIWARRELIARVSQKALQYGISESDCGDPNADSIDGRVLTKAEKQQRQTLIRRIKAEGYRQVMEEAAYTWFNRFIALRFMEVNGYLPSHVRVFTDDQGSFKPQILTEAINLDLDGLDMEKVYALKDANKTEELYKYLLIVQCNALNPILPGMFQKIEDYTELLFPDNLLREGSVIDRMVRQGESDSIPESDWTDQVQIIGWLYQYYNTEPKDQVFADLKKNIKITKEKIPAATQLFTPDWIVRYMVENSLGRLWLEGHPAAGEKFLPVHNEDGSVRKEDGKWNYYLEEAPQEPEVEAQLAEIRKEYAALTPEEIRVIDPCCGSGHILCYLFDVLEQIYEDYGYTAREAAQKIVQHNLHGLDIDPRAVQLSYFAVMMKARQYDRRFFNRNIQPMVYSPEGYPEGMEYGSLITVDELEPAPDFDNWTLHDGDYLTALNRWSFRYVLHQKYHVVVTNPPYMSPTCMKPETCIQINKRYPDSKTDLFAVFIEKTKEFTIKDCFFSLITQDSWMALKSYEKLRRKLTKTDLITQINLGIGTFEDLNSKIVQSTAFVFRKSYTEGWVSVYDRLFEREGLSENNSYKVERFFKGTHRFIVSQDAFQSIPGGPIAYWLSRNALLAFNHGVLLSDFGITRVGLQTSDNNRFLRLWFECNLSNTALNCTSLSDCLARPQKWYPHNKGGLYRRWYGNCEYVINYQYAGTELSHAEGAATIPEQFAFREAITYSRVTSGPTGFRQQLNNTLFDSAAVNIFTKDARYILGLLNSKIVRMYLSVFSPGMNTQPGDIQKIPIIISESKYEAITELVNNSIMTSQSDWDAFETSWDFQTHPLVRCASFSMAEMLEDARHQIKDMNFIKDAFVNWSNECYLRFEQLKANEEELNRIFIDIYGLQDELTPEVEDKDVTVRKADLGRDIRSFISYAVGCMFGRYSIYKEGLIYAGGEWDYNQYENFTWAAEGKPDALQFYSGTHFFPDQDNIIPITDDEYFHDDIANRFMEFVNVVYGSETLEDNLRFIADALGGKGSPRDVIRNYFLNDFYADHLKAYQKCPIYWLFDSGKKNGFKCLIYMHRYQPDTIARIRTDYVHEQQARYRTAIDELERRISDAATAERVKLNKQLAKLQAQADELRDYEEKIHHLADQMISIDLDDGVKVNYAKFQDVLAKIK